MIGFIRKQEERLAEQFIRRQYQKQGIPVPDSVTLSAQAAQIVGEAHRIVQKRGGNVWTILKEMIDDIRLDLKHR
ncbi:MAG: hypothetical protein DSY90_14895 [Deltaproteobacteria bacterium]|nr:MAG: hypothetical protein DSY90_14895 [Deltaproteobacteria bacterium]